MALDEFALIRRYFARATTSRADVILGIGDDCALLEVPPGQALAVSIDTLVEGVHFPLDTPPHAIATRAICTSLSDLAAMGAKPLWVTLALTLPHADENWVRDFSDGVFELAEQYDFALVGGDMTRGPLTISVQVHGCIAPHRALRRDGGQPDDIIYVTGNLGDGAAALAILRKEFTVSTSAYEYLQKRFYRPKPMIDQGLLLVGLAHACIDISDGLYADLNHLCEASGTGAVVDVNRLPVADCWKSYVSEDVRDKWALTGGDDYQLCFTVPRSRIAQLEDLQRRGLITASAIGKMTHKSGIVLIKQGKTVHFDHKGYNHFDST